MRRFMAVWLLFGCFPRAAAEARPDALKELTGQSEFVVAGELSADPTVTTGKAGAAGYQLELKAVTVLKNRPPKEADAVPAAPRDAESFVVRFTRAEFSDEDKLPFLKKGSKCIFFLKYKPRDNGFYAPEGLADAWLGIQPYSPGLAKTISDLGKQGPSPEKK
jgi:hypothetical protein